MITQTKPEARARLGQLLIHRAELLDQIEGLQVAAQRLAGARTDNSATNELAMLDGAEASAMAHWARTGEGPVPVHDIEKRDRIMKRIAESRAAAEAASRAEQGILAEHQRAAEAVKRLEAPMACLTAEIMVQELEPLIDEFTVSNAALTEKASRISMCASLLSDMASECGPSDSGRRPILVALEELNARLQALFARAAPNDQGVAQHRLEWNALTRRLRDDAEATLETT